MFAASQVLAVVFGVATLIVETLVLVRREKYWPLAADDYVVVALLAAAIVLDSSLLLAVAWALALGSLYATLFSRLAPGYRGVKRYGVLVLAMGWAAAGLLMALVAAWPAP